MPAFPPGCSPNLTALTLFTVDVIFPEIITPAPPAGPVITCDDFNRPFNFDLGPNWFDSQQIVVPAGLTDTFFIFGDVLRIRSVEVSAFPLRSARGVAWWSANSFNDAQSSEATFSSGPFSLQRFVAGLGVRLSGIWSNFTGYVCIIGRATTTLPAGVELFQVYRVVNCSTANDIGCWVQVGSNITPVPVNGDKITLAVSALDIVTVRVNDILVFTDSDITLDPKPTSGNPGFVSATQVADESAGETHWDDWCGTGGIA